MKKTPLVNTLSALAWLAALPAAAAATVALEPPPLPAPAFADMETSLDIPLAPTFTAPGPGADTFRVTLAFEGTASNNVQIALGRDCAPTDGALSAAETAVIAGWDRDGWFLRPRGLAERSDIPAGGGPKTLTFQVRRAAAGTLANAVFTADGAPLAFPGLSPVPEWLDPSGWDILRVTSRGTGAPDASVTVKRFPDGVTVIIK